MSSVIGMENQWPVSSFQVESSVVCFLAKIIFFKKERGGKSTVIGEMPKVGLSDNE